MKTINNLSSTSDLSLGDLLAIWNTNNGDTRKVSMNTLVEFIQSQGGDADISTLSTINGLKDINPSTSTSNYIVLGSTTLGDGLGGLYHYDSTSTLDEDGFLVIASDVVGVNGRWLRIDTNDILVVETTTAMNALNIDALGNTKTVFVKENNLIYTHNGSNWINKLYADTVANLPASANTGDVCIVGSNNLIYTYDGTNWINNLYVDTISDFPASPLDGDVCIVKDLNRGGIFTYNDTRSAENDGGTVFDGWVRQYTFFISVKWFGAKGDGSTNDTLAIQSAIDALVDLDNTVLYFPVGRYIITNTLNLTIKSLSIIGETYGFRPSGAIKGSTGLIWTGGASSIFSCNKNLITFSSFYVENLGSATSWLELTAGAQNIIFDKLSFNKVTGFNEFSEAVIVSNGARLGYSQFKTITATQPSEKFILIKDAGESGVTPMSFSERCIFRSAGTMTVLATDNSGIEGVSFKDCTVVKASGTMKLVDTTTNPVARTIINLSIDNCEFDADTAITTEFLDLENVTNVSIDNNNIYGNGSSVPFVNAVNSNLSSLKGNYAKGISYIYSADSTSLIRGVGSNSSDYSTVEGYVSGGVTRIPLTQSASIEIDSASFGSSEMGSFVCNITTADAYTFSLDKSKPQNIEEGQMFILTIRNISGGAIADPLFSASSMRASAGITAPSNNNEKTIMFRYDGTVARQIGAATDDVYTL